MPDDSTTDPASLPTIDLSSVLAGASYTRYSDKPPAIAGPEDQNTPRVLGIDEAGRGPVLGPMVYSAFYLPADQQQSLLTQTHGFNDSKVLSPAVRAQLMRLICTPGHPLHQSCGWAVKVLSARDISANMLRPDGGAHNLNAQAMEATIELIRGVVEERRVPIKEVYIDTVGHPATYQAKLSHLFPTLQITVAKKADSLYPCVSAASVVAKVTRDTALDVLYDAFKQENQQQDTQEEDAGWGSGYPSDSKCVGWLRRQMHPIFGWGNECRFSWGTAKEMLEEGKEATKVDWPQEDDEAGRISDFLVAGNYQRGGSAATGDAQLCSWYGVKVGASF